MRKAIYSATLLLLVMALAGCSTVASMAVKHVAMSQGKKVVKKVYHDLKEGKQHKQAGSERAVFVESEPPGAAIEVNGRVVGAAPLTVLVKLGPDGTVARDYRIEAHRSAPDQHAHEYSLLHYPGEPSDRAPAKITFRMAEPGPRGVHVTR